MTRLQQMDAEVKEVVKHFIRTKMPDMRMIKASFCHDLVNEFFSYSWSDFTIPAGNIPAKKWVAEKGFEVCKKSEATCLLRTGERCPDSMYWIIGKSQNYWLRPKTSAKT